MIDFKDFKKELLSDPKVKVEYDALAPEFEMVDKFMKARKKAKMSQAEVAKAMGKSLSYVAKLESRKANPYAIMPKQQDRLSLSTLRRNLFNGYQRLSVNLRANDERVIPLIKP